ncbi:uncharacterized protein NECHADRAFT_89060 [Fusarium vanettenii 77-13-4]|uniref:Uncharacterized protein n=1 Tax=Fusarium vanettenii (strain ATCC MYA-4622 / CBS 123669 / FGSC 9596 / NRRL 45880 / 77-13-4) TaxID=660122 RepID=C7ZQ25_FUSV7|nr:uncharacterized protein NECHADRAFT_89060 [Fusarium vanettenii 77-13-4]EEU33880.1 hypothetical protein NECHADRAFT_89060 [Fusarium vanettenii 77-13-4]
MMTVRKYYDKDGSSRARKRRRMDSLFLPEEAHGAASLSLLSYPFGPDRSEMIGHRRLEDEVGHSEEHDLPATAGARRIIMTTSAPLSGDYSHRLEDEEEGGNGEQGEEEDGLAYQHRSDGDEEEEEEDHRGAPSSLSSSSGGQGEHDALYSDGLRRLREALEAKYNLDNISHISYALAVNVHYTAASTHLGGGRGPANQGADMLSFGFFQGYSNLKRSIRHRPDDLLASHGLATAALTIPSTEAQRTARLRDKQQRLLAQLMRLFLKEKQLYAGVLRRFPPEIFPGILVAFAKVLEAAIAEIDRRFREGGSKGLGIALSEGVAALDRLGNFCFTSDQRVLPTKVIRLLGTIDSLKTCG